MEWKTREFLAEHGFTTHWMPRGAIFLDAAYIGRADCSYSHCIYPQGPQQDKWVFATWLNANEAGGLQGVNRWKTIAELPGTFDQAKTYAEVTIKMEKSL